LKRENTDQFLMPAPRVPGPINKKMVSFGGDNDDATQIII